MLNQLSKECLQQMGWFEGRSVDTTDSQKALIAGGFLLNEYAIRFMNEFDGLSLDYDKNHVSNHLGSRLFDVRSIVKHFSPNKAEDFHKNNILNNLGSISFDIQSAVKEFSSDWVNDFYQPILNENLCLVGEAYNKHLALYVSDAGKLYGGFDDFLELLGFDYYSGLNNLFARENVKVIETHHYLNKDKGIVYTYYQEQLKMIQEYFIETISQIPEFDTEQGGKYNYHSVLNHIADDLVKEAKIRYFIYSDSKEHFFNYLYNMFLVYQKAIAWEKESMMMGRWDYFLYPLLLGNQEFIQIFRDFKWKMTDDEEQRRSFTPRCYYTMYQALLDQDVERYQYVKDLLFKGGKPPFKLLLAHSHYFKIMDELIGAKNKDVLKTEIMELLKPRNHRTLSNRIDVMDSYGDLWSYYGMLFTKLCWLSGVEIEINHKLIDMELITYQGNDEYTILYDFLRPSEPEIPSTISDKKAKTWRDYLPFHWGKNR